MPRPKPLPPTAPELVPAGLFVMTAAFDRSRGALGVSWVQRCGQEPPCVCVAIPKGSRLGPLIRDAHAFGLCQIPDSDHLLWKHFERPAGAGHDPFDALETTTLVTGAPIIRRALAALDCSVVMHVDYESDHELYIGQVEAHEVFAPVGCAWVRERNTQL